MGDLQGTRAAPCISQYGAELARRAGFRVAMNDPYAGGAIVARHGRPAEGIHALQLEVNRDAYLAADGRSPGLGFDRMASLVALLASELGERIAAPLRAAAE
jgi:N-formylglutamate amidohydrolase